MTAIRGEVWLADLNPTKGSEQAGVRPVIVFQNNVISKFSTTVLTIPLTTNLRRASLPTSIQINKGEAGLDETSVALCHQLRVLDKTRLLKRLGAVSPEILSAVETCTLFTLGVVE